MGFFSTRVVPFLGHRHFRHGLAPGNWEAVSVVDQQRFLGVSVTKGWYRHHEGDQLGRWSWRPRGGRTPGAWTHDGPLWSTVETTLCRALWAQGLTRPRWSVRTMLGAWVLVCWERQGALGTAYKYVESVCDPEDLRWPERASVPLWARNDTRGLPFYSRLGAYLSSNETLGSKGSSNEPDPGDAVPEGDLGPASAGSGTRVRRNAYQS